MSLNQIVFAIFLLITSSLRTHAQEDDPAKAEGHSAVLHKEDNAYLLRHNPFYFAYGNPVSKVQLSFRTKLISDTPLYFGYTQLMFWAMNRQSLPFEDLTFNPELFYRWQVPRTKTLKSLDMGWMHNSNGKEGQGSRSYNSLYVRMNAEHEYKNWILRASLTGTYMHAFDDGNEDIQDFIGPLTVKVTFIQLWQAWIDKAEISLQATPAGKFAQNWQRGGYQISWAFRLGKVKLIPSFYLQYYTGYAESLLNYNQYVHAFRTGFIF